MDDKNKTASPIRFVPKPTCGSAYGFGWEKMKKFFLDLFLITVIVGVVLIPLGLMGSLDGDKTAGGVFLQIFAFAYWFLLFAPIDYGAAFVYLKAIRGEQFEVKDMFSTFENYMDVVLAKLLVTAIVAIGLFLLIVPGIIFACRLPFVKYLVMDRKMDPVSAVKESWRMTQGHAGDIFLMGLLVIPLAIAGFICFLVGLIPVRMWIRCAFASMYYAVSEAEVAKA